MSVFSLSLQHSQLAEQHSLEPQLLVLVHCVSMGSACQTMSEQLIELRECHKLRLVCVAGLMEFCSDD